MPTVDHHCVGDVLPAANAGSAPDLGPRHRLVLGRARPSPCPRSDNRGVAEDAATVEREGLDRGGNSLPAVRVGHDGCRGIAR